MNLWDSNYIQFARLLDEINAVGLSGDQYCLIAESMGLSQAQIDELLYRAETHWEKLKKVDPEKLIVKVRWGSAQTRAETYDLSDPNACAEYEFSTPEEVAAFLKGINEGDGYLDADVWDEDIGWDEGD